MTSDLAITHCAQAEQRIYWRRAFLTPLFRRWGGGIQTPTVSISGTIGWWQTLWLKVSIRWRAVAVDGKRKYE